MLHLFTALALVVARFAHVAHLTSCCSCHSLPLTAATTFHSSNNISNTSGKGKINNNNNDNNTNTLTWSALKEQMACLKNKVEALSLRKLRQEREKALAQSRMELCYE
jgi:hypothetical protein